MGTTKEIAAKTAFFKLELTYNKLFKIKPKSKMKIYIKFSDVKNKVMEKMLPKKQKKLALLFNDIAKDKQKDVITPEILAKLKINPKTKNKISKNNCSLCKILSYFKILSRNKNHPFFWHTLFGINF